MKASYKVLFSRLIVGRYTLATFEAALREMKPWTMPRDEKIEVDKGMVRAICAHRGYEVGEDGRKFSKLTIARPEMMNEAQERDYGRCKTALSRMRDLFDKPKAATVLSHGDAKKREAARAAKLLTSERDLESFISAVRRAFAAKS